MNQTIDGTLEYISTSGLGRGRFTGWESEHGAGLVIVTPRLDEVLLVQRAGWTTYHDTWSNPGGYRLKRGPFLEDPLKCAVRETIEEIGSLPEGRIRPVPHVQEKAGSLLETTRTYHTYVLELGPSERRRFQSHIDYDELQDWAWMPIVRINEQVDLHPGLKRFFAEYRF